MDYIILIIAILALIAALYSWDKVRNYASPFIPSSKKKIRQMITMANLKKTDTIMDLGSGDGRIVLMCADHVQHATGIEINALLTAWSNLMKKVKRKTNTTFITGDFWKTNISDIDVLMLFCIKSEMPGLKEKIQKEMKPGSRVISNIFSFPDWEPEQEKNGIRVYKIKD